MWLRAARRITTAEKEEKKILPTNEIFPIKCTHTQDTHTHTDKVEPAATTNPYITFKYGPNER